MKRTAIRDKTSMEMWMVCVDIQWMDNTPRYTMRSAPRQGTDNVPGHTMDNDPGHAMVDAPRRVIDNVPGCTMPGG